MMRSSVDFPEPLGPSSAVSEPPSTSSETSSSAVKLPNRFETLQTSIDVYAVSSCGRIRVIASRTPTASNAKTIEIAYAPARSKLS